jgi:hypothetical protein
MRGSASNREKDSAAGLALQSYSILCSERNRRCGPEKKPSSRLMMSTPATSRSVASRYSAVVGDAKGGKPRFFCETKRRCRYKGQIVDEVAWAKNRTKSKVRARVEHVFQVMKLKFGFVKVRYRGLKKNAHRLFVTCALVNLFVSRRKLLAVA